MDYYFLSDMVYGKMVEKWQDKIEKEVWAREKDDIEKQKNELEQLLGEENSKKLKTYVHSLSLINEEIYFMLAKKMIRYSVFIGMELQKDYDINYYE